MRIHAVLWFALVVVAACNDDGVSIEVRRGSTAAERVELYVVDNYCTTDDAGQIPCPQLKTPSSPGYLDGEVYTREDARTLEAKVESDGVAYFTIRSDGDRTRIPLAVAVGFDANGARVGAAALPFEFYTTDANRHIVTLKTIVEGKVTGMPTSDGLRAETWYQEPGLGGGCLALEETSNGTSTRKFIVPADDLDCDGWMSAEQECDPVWPDHGPDDDSTLAFTCLTEESSPGNIGTRCMLGDAPCIDGEGPPECKAVMTGTQKWCVPSALCDPLCAGSPGANCLYNVLQHPTMPPLRHPAYVHCTLPAFPGMTGRHVCDNEVQATFNTPLPIAATASCSMLSFGPVTPTQIGPFVTRRTTSTGPMNTVETILNQTGCELSLKVSGDFPTSATLTDVLPQLVIKLDLSNGISLVVPLVVELEPTDEAECANAVASCVVVGPDAANGSLDESLAACARF